VVIHLAGLGPGRAALLTGETRALLASAPRVVLRTRRHPAVAEIPGSEAWESCDDLYEAGTSFENVYTAIAARVLEFAAQGDVVFAVPGHPLVAEASVARVLEMAAAASLATVIHPAISYVDAAAAALRQDLGSVQLCDALALRLDAQRPALIGQVYDRDTASRLKVTLLGLYPPEHPVTVLSGLATEAQRVTSVPLAEMDHFPWGYLDSLYVPALSPEADVRSFDGLHAVVRRLHAPGGCPWDREQTHASLRHYLLEETYELLEAIDSGEVDRLIEELGDVLLQVLMHTSVGEREGTFEFADVAEHLSRKLVRRHPHVFGDSPAASAAELHRRWDELKRVEKPRASALDGVPASLPALAQSQSVQGRARRTGFDWPDLQGPLDKLAEEVAEFAQAGSPGEREAEFGDILFVIAGIGQRLGIDAEQALRGATQRFRERFAALEAIASSRGLQLSEMSIDEIVALWEEAKAAAAT
jgi:tetrapyrrole methylase family protein/MazG family protein